VKKLILLFAIMAFSMSADASQIVYEYSFPTDSLGHTTTGTIVTDGTIGDLQRANIIGWTQSVYVGSTLTSHVGPFVPNPTLNLDVQGVLRATSTYLELPPPLLPSVGHENVTYATFTGDNFSLRFSNTESVSTLDPTNPVSTQQLDSSPVGLGGDTTPWQYHWSTSAPGENVTFIIATVASVPEPSSMMLAGLGLAALLAYRWRR
jgi:hypothetical protein